MDGCAGLAEQSVLAALAQAVSPSRPGQGGPSDRPYAATELTRHPSRDSHPYLVPLPVQALSLEERLTSTV